MPTQPVPTILPGELSETELRACVLDGELYPVGAGFLPVDLPADAACRAASLVPVLPGGTLAAGTTAAWVWGALPDLPLPLHALVAPGRARPRHLEPSVRVRQAPLGPDDTTVLGGVTVATALRTAVDLLVDPGGSLPAVARLVRREGLDLQAIAARLRARRAADAHVGGQRLQVLVTRYTS